MVLTWRDYTYIYMYIHICIYIFTYIDRYSYIYSPERLSQLEIHFGLLSQIERLDEGASDGAYLKRLYRYTHTHTHIYVYNIYIYSPERLSQLEVHLYLLAQVERLDESASDGAHLKRLHTHTHIYIYIYSPERLPQLELHLNLLSQVERLDESARGQHRDVTVLLEPILVLLKHLGVPAEQRDRNG